MLEMCQNGYEGALPISCMANEDSSPNSSEEEVSAIAEDEGQLDMAPAPSHLQAPVHRRLSVDGQDLLGRGRKAGRVREEPA